MLGSPVAFWISPDGQHLAFATFNDTNVHDIVISKYGSPGNLRDQYPNEIKIKYPKVDIFIFFVFVIFKKERKKKKRKVPLRFLGRKSTRVEFWREETEVQRRERWFKKGLKGDGKGLTLPVSLLGTHFLSLSDIGSSLFLYIGGPNFRTHVLFTPEFPPFFFFFSLEEEKIRGKYSKRYRPNSLTEFVSILYDTYKCVFILFFSSSNSRQVLRTHSCP